MLTVTMESCVYMGRHIVVKEQSNTIENLIEIENVNIVYILYYYYNYLLFTLLLGKLFTLSRGI